MLFPVPQAVSPVVVTFRAIQLYENGAQRMAYQFWTFKKSSQHLLTKYLTSKNHMTELKPQQAINHGFASFRQQLLTKYGGKVFFLKV